MLQVGYVSLLITGSFRYLDSFLAFKVIVGGVVTKTKTGNSERPSTAY